MKNNSVGIISRKRGAAFWSLCGKSLLLFYLGAVILLVVSYASFFMILTLQSQNTSLREQVVALLFSCGCTAGIIYAHGMAIRRVLELIRQERNSSAYPVMTTVVVRPVKTINRTARWWIGQIVLLFLCAAGIQALGWGLQQNVHHLAASGFWGNGHWPVSEDVVENLGELLFIFFAMIANGFCCWLGNSTIKKMLSNP
jgi:hypothetical protein